MNSSKFCLFDREKSHRLENRDFSLSLEMTAYITTALLITSGTYWGILSFCKSHDCLPFCPPLDPSCHS